METFISVSEHGRGGGIPSAAKGRGLVRVGKPVPGEQRRGVSSYSLYPAGTGTEGAAMVYLSVEATLLPVSSSRGCGVALPARHKVTPSCSLGLWLLRAGRGQNPAMNLRQHLAVQGHNTKAPCHPPPPPPEPPCGGTAPVPGEPALPSLLAFVVPPHRTGTSGCKRCARGLC